MERMSDLVSRLDGHPNGLTRRALDRRRLLGLAAGGAALAGASGRLVRPTIVAAHGGAHAGLTGAPAAADPDASPVGWRTWFLRSPDELRPAAPGAAGTDEVEAVAGYQAHPTDEMKAAIATWGSPANIPWSEAIMSLHDEFGVPGRMQCRNLPLLHAALSDAALAAWDAQLAHARPGPAATDHRIAAPSGVDPARPTFPSAAAAVAGAAAAVLAYLFPDAKAGRLDDMANEAATSRVWAGECFPSDAAAGLALGRAIGEKAVEYGMRDGSDAKWDESTMPSGDGTWQPTPPTFASPLAPLGGTWKTWVLGSGDAIRPGPPPEYGSARWKAELEAVQVAVANRTLDELRLAQWYQLTAPFPPFNTWAHELIRRGGLDLPHATRVMAYLNVAYADAVTAVWDAKYTWWTERPITADSTIATAFATPPYPAFPSGYSAVAGAGSMTLGYFFPEAAADLDELGWEATRSRAWAGIHYMIDNEIGMCMGRTVGRLVNALAHADGIERA